MQRSLERFVVELDALVIVKSPTIVDRGYV
jgi:hypothetical protein